MAAAHFHIVRTAIKSIENTVNHHSKRSRRNPYRCEPLLRKR